MIMRFSSPDFIPDFSLVSGDSPVENLQSIDFSIEPLNDNFF